MSKTDEEKIKLISKWSDWFYNNTESFEGDGLGTELAYLYAAIAKGNKIEIFAGGPLYNLIVDRVDTSDDLWSYITVVVPDTSDADAADFEVGDMVMDAIEENKGD